MPKTGTVTFRFVCSNCGDTLEVYRDGDFFEHGEYHSCFGEQVRTVALINDDRINVTRDGVEIEFTEKADEEDS